MESAGIYDVKFDSSGQRGIVYYKGFQLTCIYSSGGRNCILNFIREKPNAIISEEYRQILDLKAEEGQVI